METPKLSAEEMFGCPNGHGKTSEFPCVIGNLVNPPTRTCCNPESPDSTWTARSAGTSPPEIQVARHSPSQASEHGASRLVRAVQVGVGAVALVASLGPAMGCGMGVGITCLLACSLKGSHKETATFGALRHSHGSNQKEILVLTMCWVHSLEAMCWTPEVMLASRTQPLKRGIAFWGKGSKTPPVGLS